jgi:acetyltransferase EpsM
MINNKINNTLIWGGGLRSLKIYTCLNNLSTLNKQYLGVKNTKIKTKYIFDTFISSLNFKTNSIFSNQPSDLDKIINDCSFFIVAVGSAHGKARYLTSKELEKRKLFPLGIVNKFSVIDKTALIGKGPQIEPGAIIQGHCQIGDYCIVNTNATLDHGSIIGNGCHIMTGASIAGRVQISDYVSIGTNATILPDIKIASGAYIGAGSVVTKDVKKNEVVTGNPAKKIKLNIHKFDLSSFKFKN